MQCGQGKCDVTGGLGSATAACVCDGDWVDYQKRPVSLDGELGAFFLEAKYGNVLKKSTVTNTCLTGRSAADEATTTIPTVAEELAKCTSDAARERALECYAPGKACGTWYAQCLFEACLYYVPGEEGRTNHMIDSLMFKEQGFVLFICSPFYQYKERSFPLDLSATRFCLNKTFPYASGQTSLCWNTAVWRTPQNPHHHPCFASLFSLLLQQ